MVLGDFRQPPFDSQPPGRCLKFERSRNSKLVLNFSLGRRNQTTTNVFIEGLAQSIGPRQNFQITTDGFAAYHSAIDTTLGHRVDFVQLIKVYRSNQEGEARYSPAEVASMEVVPVIGQPDPARICTSIVERQNLTIRMQMRRLILLTNAFSRKWENLWAACCLHLRALQFLSDSQIDSCYARDGSRISDHVWYNAKLLA